MLNFFVAPEDQPIVDEQLDVVIIVVGSNDIMDYAEQWAGRAQGSLGLQQIHSGVMISEKQPGHIRTQLTRPWV